MMVEVRGLTKSYRTRRVLDNVTFQVAAGEVFGILGPNGAGKTTLVRILTSVINASSGDVRINGFDLNRDATEIRRIISRVPQGLGLSQQLDVKDNIYTYLRLLGFSRKKALERTDFALEQFELLKYATRPIQELSGGYKRRVLIARVFASDAKVVFLDEPTTGLDPETKRLTWELVKTLVKSQQRTVVLTTQLMDEAEALCQRVMILKDGKVVAVETLENLRASIGIQTIVVQTQRALKMNIKLFEQSIEAVQSAYLESPTKLILKTTQDPRVMSLILSLLNVQNVRIDDIQVLRGTFEDIYLSLTQVKEVRDELSQFARA